MALTERKIIGRIDIGEDEQIGIREDTIIERDGIEVLRTYWRTVLAPGDPIPERIQNTRITAVTNALWTANVVRAFRERREQAIARVTQQPRPVA